MEAEVLAHVRELPNGNWLGHELYDHLESVRLMASQFAKSFDSDDWAGTAGRWHDLGKYSAEFQQYLRNASGYEREEAHIARADEARAKSRDTKASPPLEDCTSYDERSLRILPSSLDRLAGV